MKTADHAKNLRNLLKKIGKVDPPDLPGDDDPLGVLVMSFLLWESTTEKATAAFDRLMDAVVDYNDLRVCMPHETAELIGERYPKAVERCQRLRACLRDVYLREHSVTVERLATAGKRDVRKYIESLDGIVPFVAARVLLLCYDTHSIPVDEQLRSHLVKAAAAEESMDVAELAVWLNRQVKASASIGTHAALQSWVEQQGRAARSRSTRKPTTKKKTTSTPAKSKKTSSAARRTPKTRAKSN